MDLITYSCWTDCCSRFTLVIAGPVDLLIYRCTNCGVVTLFPLLIVTLVITLLVGQFGWLSCLRSGRPLFLQACCPFTTDYL